MLPTDMDTWPTLRLKDELKRSRQQLTKLKQNEKKSDLSYKRWMIFRNQYHKYLTGLIDKKKDLTPPVYPAIPEPDM